MNNWVFVMAMLSMAIFPLHAEEKVVLIHGPEVDLTLEDVKRTFAVTEPELLRGILSDPKKLRNAMDSTYLTKVAAHRARHQGLDKLPEVRARIWNRTLNILAEADVERVVEEKLAAADFEAAAKERYLLEKDRFRRPERVKVSHILIKFEGKQEEEARQRIERIREEIVSGKIGFEEAARKYSEDRSANRGGSLGVLGKGRMVKPFEDVAFSLEEGEISQPVKTRFGFHLVRVEKKIPAKILSFEEVKKQLLKEARGEARKAIIADYWLQIRDDPEVKLNEEAIQSFLDKPDYKLE